MFSHAAMVRFDNNTIPAVHVIPVQAQNLFAIGPNNCETVYKQGNFLQLFLINHRKCIIQSFMIQCAHVDSPYGSHAENFKVLAERNGIKVVDPEVHPKIENGLNEMSVVTPSMFFLNDSSPKIKQINKPVFYSKLSMFFF